MNNVRNVLCVLSALALATFALPSVADNGKKQFSLVMSAPSAPPYTVLATIKNEGNSTISSFSLSFTGMTIVGVSPPATGTAVGLFPGTSVSVTHMQPLKSGDSLTLTLQVNACGDGAWSAGAVAWTGSSLNGQTFNLVVADSTLTTAVPCADVAGGAGFAVPNNVTPNCGVTGLRGYYDENGLPPVGSLPIFVTNTVPVNDQLHFRWPDVEAGGDPLATFDYTICGPGALPDLTYVAWLNVDGSPASKPGTPAYVPAQDCNANADFLPMPYGTVVADNGGSIIVNTIAIPTGVPSLTTPPTPPFDFVIGTERMTMLCSDGDGDESGDGADTSECGEVAGNENGQMAIWYVARGVGGTTATTHVAGDFVMSTPLPLLGASVSCFDASGAQLSAQYCPYKPLSQALMCIQSQTPECTGDETENCDNGIHSTTVIDIGGDGWANHP